jgi:prepilin-type processing-associated H-X9-DG protein
VLPSVRPVGAEKLTVNTASALNGAANTAFADGANAMPSHLPKPDPSPPSVVVTVTLVRGLIMSTALAVYRAAKSMSTDET